MLNEDEFYFYSRKVRPKDYEVYFYAQGIVGYREEKENQKLYFKGTEKELMDYHKNRKVPRVIHSKGTLVNY